MRRLVLILILVLAAAVATSATAVGAPKKKPSATGTQAWWGSTCGGPVKKADGSLWRCTMDDEFVGNVLDRSLWRPDTGAISGTGAEQACSVNDPKAIAVSGGALRLTVRKTESPVSCRGNAYHYAYGELSTYHRFSQQYGRFEARIKVAATDQDGLQESFWMWPDDRYSSTATYPASGEIDIAETYSQFPHLAVPFLHYTPFDNFGPHRGLNTAEDCAAQRGVFNTYDLTWTPDSLTIAVNGKTCLVNTSGDKAFKKPYITVLTAALGAKANAAGPTTPLPATMAVDYVRAWQ